MALPPRLSENLISLFRDAVQSSGSYKAEDNIFYFEESLTLKESRFAWAFFEWLSENKKTFGQNLPYVYLEFKKEAGMKYIEKYWETH